MIVSFFKEFKTIFFSGVLTFSSLITTLIFTKFLNQSEYGEYGFFITVGQLVMVFSSWGFLNWGVNEITKNIDMIEEIFNHIIKSRIITGLIATTIVLVCFILFYTANHTAVLIISYILYSLSFSISPEILYISNNNQNFYLKKSILTRLVFIFVSSYLLFSYEINPELLFFIFALALFANSFILLFIQNYIKLIPSIQLNIENIKKSSPNFNLILVSFLFASGPLIFIGAISDPANFTVVFASVTIIKALQVIYNPSIQKILPDLNEVKNLGINEIKVKISRGFFMGLLYSLSCIIFILLFADLIVNIVYSKDYFGIQNGLKIFSMSVIPGIYSTIISTQLSVFFNFIKTATLVTLASAIALFLIILVSFNFDLISNEIFLYTLVAFEYIQALFLTLVLFKKVKNYSNA